VVKRTIQALADFLVEERCHVCGRAPGARVAMGPVHPLAEPVAIPLILGSIATRPLCSRCAARVHPWVGAVVVGDAGDPGHALLARPAFEAGDVLLKLIHLLKFGGYAALAPWLARAVACALPPLDPAADVPLLVPVPMDRASRRLRGFNQAERIAAELARAWRAPLARRALVKLRRTAPQSSLGREERAANLRGAIAAGPDAVRGRSVVIVDDLVTTGATVAACARPLFEAGAASVRVACVGYRP
jgi:ComF family protein